MKKITALSAVLLSVTFLTGCVFQPFNKTTESETPTAVKQYPKPNQKPANQPLDTTASWPIYQNEKYGYELRYPQDWFAFWLERTSGGPRFHKEDVSQRDNVMFAAKYPNDYDYNDDLNNYALLEIDLQNGEFFIKDSRTVDDFWNKLGKKNEGSEGNINKFIKKEIIDSVDFIFFQQYNWSVKDQKNTWTPQALFMYQGNFFWIRGNDIMENELFNQILSTIKFNK